MSRAHYQPHVSESGLEYTFTSIGPKGAIVKKIVYRAFENNPSVFNLGMGDLSTSGFFDDKVISNNRDLPEIARAVGRSLLEFFKRYPDASVFVQGLNQGRTRLFRMLITAHQTEMDAQFVTYGLLDNAWQVFEPDRPYSAYLIQKK